MENKEIKSINCCYLSRIFEGVAGSFYTSVENKKEEEIKEADIGFQIGGVQAVLMTLATLKVEDKLCEKCAEFEEKIEDPNMKQMVADYIKKYREDKYST